MRLHSIFIFSLFFSSTIIAQPNSQLHQDIEKLLAEQQLSGAVWTVVDSSGITTGCAGFKNAGSKEKLKATNRVHVGSLAKTILAVGVLHLATEGRLNLDEAISKYLPNTPFVNKWAVANPVTVRHLLDHTSGLSDAKLWHIFSTSSTPNTTLATFYKDDPLILTIQAKPGALYSYSNMGYTILGMLVENVTNQRYENYLDENILKPLKMHNSTFQFVTQVGDHKDTNLAMGHFDNGDTIAALSMYLRPAGQVTTTAYDMGLFLQFLMSDGKINGIQWIDEKYLLKIGKPASTEAYQNGVPYGYALGAYTRDRYGVTGISVTGNILGFAARMYWFPDEEKAFFISHNMDSETADYDIFNATLVKHLNLKARTLNLPRLKTVRNLYEWNGCYIPVITHVVPFKILDDVFSFTKVTISDSGADLKPLQKKLQRLNYIGNNLFSLEGRTNISHSFYKNENGTLLITDGISTIKKVSGMQILLIAVSFVLGLLGMIYLLLSSVYQLFKFKRSFLQQPILFLSFAFLIILAAISLLFKQPFTSLGDKTIGNSLLYIGTLLMPLLTMVSLIKYLKFKKNSWLYNFDFLSLLFVLQLFVLLLLNDIMPLALWK